MKAVQNLSTRPGPWLQKLKFHFKTQNIYSRSQWDTICFSANTLYTSQHQLDSIWVYRRTHLTKKVCLIHQFHNFASIWQTLIYVTHMLITWTRIFSLPSHEKFRLHKRIFFFLYFFSSLIMQNIIILTIHIIQVLCSKWLSKTGPSQSRNSKHFSTSLSCTCRAIETNPWKSFIPSSSYFWTKQNSLVNMIKVAEHI